MKHVHFIAIGGAGMSSVAQVLLAQGFQVSGSDLQESPWTERLERMGARVYLGHRATNVNGADMVVVSSAIRSDNEELVHTRAMGIPVVHRAEMLALLMEQKQGIAIAGAHGKTTTTSMISHVLERANYDPTVLVGGEITNMGSNARLGQGRYLVAEADESDGSFLKLRPHIAVVTNIDDDHLEHYGSMEALESTFAQFLAPIPSDGMQVLCGDDQRLRRIAQMQKHGQVAWYGFGPDNEWQARDLKSKRWGLEFSVYRHGAYVGQVELQVIGKHNALNALAALVVADGIGIAYEQAAAALAQFTGVGRRLQLIGEKAGVRVMDDYGHHPTEIRATLNTLAEQVSGRIICIFQPHRYARTLRLCQEFGRCFYPAYKVLLLDIYPGPGEIPIPEVTTALVATALEENGKDVLWLPDYETIIDEVVRVVASGDVVITMGCGDVWRLGVHLMNALG